LKIYIVRHGESVDDIEDCYGGIADFPLTDAGRETAEKLASKLANTSIKILYTSPYKRAHETASIICKKLGCELKVIDDLRERNSYGVLSGVNKKKAEEIFSGILAKLKYEPGDFYSDELVTGAEPLDEFASRVREAFNKVVEDGEGQNIIGIVTHGNVTRAIYRYILGIKTKVKPSLLAITVIDFQPVVVELNREQTQGVEM
jgi:broad specificity phosphatase PhoE